MIFKGLLEDIFYEADIFKVPFSLLFHNRKKSSTIFGSIFSFIIVGIVLYLFFTSNMMLKINPNVIDQVTTNPAATLIELTPENFEIAAGVADSFGKGYSDPTIFKIQFIQIEIGFNETINSKQITNQTIFKTKQCNQSSFADPTTFQNFGFANYTCLDDGNFQIEGGFDEKSLKAVVVMISYCNSSSDGVICKNLTEIDNFFQDKGLWLYYQDDIYDVSNYQNPINKNWRLLTVQCTSVPRINDLYLKKLIFINDDQFLFTDEHYQYGFMKESTEQSSDYVMVASPLISINIFSSKNNQKTKRQYQKLGELVASIGGIINVLIIVGFVITNLENQLQMQNHIMNTLYSYSYHPREKIHSNQKGNSMAKIDHHLWDWNKEYDETINKDEKRKKPPEPKELKEPGVDINNEITFSADLQEQQKLHFVKLDVPRESSRKTSHINGRVLSPVLRPKELSVVDDYEFEDDKYFKDVDDSKPITMKIYQYLKMTLKDFFNMALSEKERLFLLSEQRFKRETDICHILEKIQEFEKLKLSIFSHDQINLFNLLAKPLVSLDNQKEEEFGRTSTEVISRVKNDSKRRIQEMKKYYRKMSEGRHMSFIDKNLLKLIEDDIFTK